MLKDLDGRATQCYVVKTVAAEIQSVFDTAVNSAKDVLRRLLGYLPITKAAIPRSILESVTLVPSDIPLMESFFETEYHRAGKDQLARDLITSIENWVIQRIEAKWKSGEEVNLLNFLVELGQEQMGYYSKWDGRKIAVESSLSCREDPTLFQNEDLAKVKSLNLGGKILDQDKEILATLYRVTKQDNVDVVFTTVDYSLFAARTLIEPALGLTISDPLYAVQKLS